MLKERENPPITYPKDVSVTTFSGQWWVVHTKSRNEKALAQELCARDISYFLPMTLKVSRKSHRRFKSLLPLFTGYLFFCGRDEQRLEVLRTNRVANMLEVNDQETLISELYQIEKAIRAGVPLVPHDYIRRGQWCRVIAGPLMGLEGIVLEARQGTRLILQVDILGQATSVEIDIHMIEPIDEPTYKTHTPPPFSNGLG